MEKSPSKTPRTDEPISISRRRFMQGGGGTIASAYLAGVGYRINKIVNPPVYQSTHAQTVSRERSPVSSGTVAEFSERHSWKCWDVPHPREPTNQDMELIDVCVVALREFEQMFSRRFQVTCERANNVLSHVQQNEARQEFLRSSLPGIIRRTAEAIVNFRAGGMSEGGAVFGLALRVSAACACQGVLYRAIERNVHEQGGTVNFAREKEYYQTRIQDYLPHGEDIWSQDIDPRNRSGLGDRELNTLRENPGWSGRAHKEAFRRLTLHQGITRLAEQEQMTIAEYFSLLKAIVHERQNPAEQDHGQETIEQTAVRLIAMHREFLYKSIADSTTERAILFYGRDRQGLFHGTDEHRWQEILEAAGVARRKIEKIASGRILRGAAIVDRLHRAVATSHGKTLITFDTHGAPDMLLVDNVNAERGDEILPIRRVAEMLIERVIARSNPNTLQEVTMIIGACHAFDFAKNLKQAMARCWGEHSRPFPFARLKLPTIIASAQEQAQAIKYSLTEMLLAEQKTAIRADHKLSGERLLRNVQPRAYQDQDMTFFAPGANVEFGERRQKRNSAIV